MWPAGEALAQCAPPAVGAAPSGATVNCNGAVLNQNTPDGYGTGLQTNDAINVQTGSVTGTSSGFNIGSGNTVTLSSGTTVTGGANGISASGATPTLTVNNNGGTVSGNGANAIVNGIVTSGTLGGTNSGTISATSTAAGGSAIAINPSTSVNLTSTAGSHITATANGGEAVGVQSNAVTLNNSGTMTVTGGTASGSFGVFGLTSVNVTNNGSMSVDDTGGAFEAIGVVSNGTLTLVNNAGASIQATGVNADAVLAAGATSVTNGGTITGALDGVNTNTSAITSVINSGTIAGTGRNGVRVNTASVANNAGGLITGLTGILFRPSNGASTVFDGGTITGTGGTAIQFSTGSIGNTLTLAPTFAINGNVLGAGSDILQLGGTGNGTFNLNNIGAAAQYQGFTTFNKTDASTWTIIGTGNEAWTVMGGTFIVNGTINGAVNVTGGTLAGTGTVGATTINAGATFAPGTPGVPGTSMTVSGNLAFQSGAIYLVQVSPASATSANVSGTATLAGNVLAAFGPGSFISKKYDILHASSVSGTFAALGTTNLPANFSASLSYTPTDVFLNLSVVALGTGLPLNQNQQNVANSINNFFNAGGTLTPSFLSLFALNGGNLAATLSQLSGEAATDAQTAQFQMLSEFLGLMIDPTMDSRGSAGGGAIGFAPERPDMPEDIALAYAKAVRALKAPPPPVVYDPRWTVWGTGFGGYSKTNGDPVVGSNDVVVRTAGGAAGADYHFSREMLVGFALAGGETNWALAQALGGGRSDTFEAGLYGKTYLGPAYLAASLAFADGSFTTNRMVLNDQLTARFNGQSYGGRLEGGYRLAAWPGFGVTPYAAVQSQSFHTPSYSETGIIPGGFGLSFNSRNASDTRSELGFRFDEGVMLGAMPLTLRARAAWAHDWITNPTLTAAFESLPGAGFVVNGAVPAKDRALASVGGDLHIAPNWMLQAKFDGEFASRTQTYAGTGTLRYTW